MIIPLFKSHYSISRSCLTLEPSGTSSDGSSDSIFDILKENSLTDLYLVEDGMCGFIKSYEMARKEGVNLHFGLRLTILNDMNQKDEESLDKESKIIIFMKNTAGYKSLMRIFSKAATDGLYYIPRIDWNTLKSMWDDSLILCIPFYDSFLYKNFMVFNSSSVPELFVKPYFCIEEHELPFDPLIKDMVNNFCSKNNYEMLKTHTIYYKNNSDAKAYMTFRAIHNRSTLAKPNLEHFASDKFSAEFWKTL